MTIEIPEALRGREAVLRLHQFKFDIVREGGFVRCAVTGRSIPLEELKYWNAEAGEVYIDAQTAHARWVARGGKPGSGTAL